MHSAIIVVITLCFDGSELHVKPGFGVYERIQFSTVTLHDKLDYLLDLQMQSEEVSMRTTEEL